MRLHIADPALVGNRGHHANFAHFIAAEARSRSIDTRVLAHRSVSDKIQQNLRAVPWFRVNTYAGDADPISGWLVAFFNAKNATREDLAKLTDIRAEDIVYVQGAQPAQLMAATEWMSGLPEDQCPLVVVELGGDSGVRFKPNPRGEMEMDLPDPRTDGYGRAVLFRFAARYMHALGSRPLHVVTFDPGVSAVYSGLMERDVGVLPFLTGASGTVRSRAGKRPITIATLGHQQGMKGYHLLPEIAQRILKAERDIELLIHNSDPDFDGTRDGVDELREAQTRLRTLADKEPRLILDERAVDAQAWEHLVAATDLMLCPYNPVRYAGAHSGVAAVAIANAIPSVVPEGTTLAHWQARFGETGTTFSEWDVRHVARAVSDVVKHFDRFAERAFAAASRWSESQGPGKCLDEILTLNQRRWTRRGVSAPLHQFAESGATAATTLKLRGDQLLRQGEVMQARKSYEEALGKNPAFGEAAAGLALACQATGDSAGAEKYLRRATELLPHHAVLLSNLGVFLHQTDRHAEAVSYLERAAAMQPDDGMIKSNLGSVLLRLNRVPEAILALEGATTVLSSEPVAWFNLGNARVVASDWGGAVEAYSRTLALRPDFPEAKQALARALSALGTMAPNLDFMKQSFAPPADSSGESRKVEQT